MASFAPVTESELARARSDSAFRKKLLEENLELLLAGIKKLRKGAGGKGQAVPAEQIREAVELAVKLAEMIQSPAKAKRA